MGLHGVLQGTLRFISRTQHNCTPTQFIFNRNSSDTSHKQGTISCPQNKGLPRSTVNSFELCTVTRSVTPGGLNGVTCEGPESRDANSPRFSVVRTFRLELLAKQLLILNCWKHN